VNTLLGIISLLGALFLSYLTYESLFRKAEINLEKTKAESLKKGIITNALNPHPYLFYFTVGGTTLLKALSIKISFIY